MKVIDHPLVKEAEEHDPFHIDPEKTQASLALLVDILSKTVIENQNIPQDLKQDNSFSISNLINSTSSKVSFSKKEPVRMRVRKNRWYGNTSINDPGTGKRRQIEFTLDAYKWEKHKAIINYGKYLERIERGELPTSRNLKFVKVAQQWKRNPVCLKEVNHGSHENLTIMNETLIPYFGEMRVKEITKDVVKKYLSLMESDSRPRTKKFQNTERKVRGKSKGTLEKELRVLKWVMQTVSKTWEPPYWVFKNKEKKKVGCLTFEEVSLMVRELKNYSKSYGREYQDVAWVMAYTGLDISDATRLSRSSFQSGLIVGERGKTGKAFQIGVSDSLKSILNSRISPLDPKAPLFKVPSADAVSTVIKRAFKKVGLAHFHAKSLRDFHASILFNAGFSELFIQQTLGHTPGSSETKKYVHASKEEAERAARTFDFLQEKDLQFTVEGGVQ